MRGLDWTERWEIVILSMHHGLQGCSEQVPCDLTNFPIVDLVYSNHQFQAVLATILREAAG